MISELKMCLWMCRADETAWFQFISILAESWPSIHPDQPFWKYDYSWIFLFVILRNPKTSILILNEFTYKYVRLWFI